MLYSKPSDCSRLYSVICGAFVVASVGCTAQERDLSVLMQAGQTSTSGGAGTAPAGGASTTNTTGVTGGHGNEGGAAGVGGSNGGSTAVGGTAGTSTTVSGGTTNSTVSNTGGGGVALGGASSTATSALPGGGFATGGVASNGGSAGAGVTGGTVSIGGTESTGGALGTGGTDTIGGAGGIGGTVNESTGGALTSGGTSATGGIATTGGAQSTGGTTAVVGPSVVVASGSVADNGTTNLTTATFAFASSPTGAAVKFECSVNSTSNYNNCTSSISLTDLGAGKQELYVRAYNASNVVGPVLKRTWTVAALSTTIKAIRTNPVAVDTLVSISTNVRLTGMYTVSNNQVIFVQEADYKGTYSVDKAADLDTGVLNSGILTRPPSASPQSAKTIGTAVTVTGTLKSNQNNAELVRASYEWGAAGTAYSAPSIRTSDVIGESLEGVYIDLLGDAPGTNCGACNNTNGYKCLEGCSGQCNPLSWTQIAGTMTTSSYGSWQGFLVQTGSYYTLWVVESSDYSDACL